MYYNLHMVIHMCFLMYQRHYRVPLSYDLTTFQILGQKFVKFFVGILVQTMRPKGHFEINWPLVKVSSLQPKLTFVIGNGNQE